MSVQLTEELQRPRDQVETIDVVDLNYLYTSERLGTLDRNENVRVRGVWGCALLFVAQMLKSLVREFRRDKRMPQQASVLFVVESRNQYVAVRPVAELLPDSAELSVSGLGRGAFPTFSAYLASLQFLPKFLRDYRASSGYLRKAYQHIGNEILLTRGYYLAARHHLGRLKPKILVLANDHNMRNRVLRLAAAHEGITTAYIPHASVTANFPPLAFDYALLEGRDMAEKYKLAGSSSTAVFLVGTPRADHYVQRAKRPGQSGPLAVGVCTNMLDRSEDVIAVLDSIIRELPEYRIELRPHPRDSRPWGVLIGTRPVSLSDANKEASFDFLSRLDAIVAGDSGIVLEAAMVRVGAFQFAFGRTFEDYYGFVQKGIANYLPDAGSLCTALRAFSLQGAEFVNQARRKAAWYCASLDTAFEGHSGFVAARLLMDILEGNDPYNLALRNSMTGKLTSPVFELTSIGHSEVVLTDDARSPDWSIASAWTESIVEAT